MKKTALLLALILILLISAATRFCFVNAANAEAMVVPDDYSTIQEAINHANNGDTVLVKSGTYSENVTVNKPLVLKGETSVSSIINGGITVKASDVAIDSFTLVGPETGNGGGTFSYGLQVIGNQHTTTAAFISNCIFNGWVIAISVDGGNGNKIINNTISNTNVGIDICSSDNIISGNNIQTRYGGINVAGQYLSNNLIFRNKISSEVGIGVNWYNSNNQIFENSIRDCTTGIHLGAYPEGYGPCSNNKIFHNNFIDNTNQTYLGPNSTNSWDNGYPSGGNYWSDYTGADSDGDGIGDTPHTIDSGNKDNYPLMTPFIIPEDSYKTVDFTNSFRDNDGNLLYSSPSSFKLTFPNGTTSAPLQVGTYQIPTGITVLYSVVWQGTEIKPEETFTFDSFNGNPDIKCRVYSLTIDPTFYDNNGAPVKPTSWTIRFPNGTTTTVSSTVIYSQTQTGWYSVVDVLLYGVNIEINEVTQLVSNKIWTPENTAYIPPVLVYDIVSNSTITERAFNETEKAISFLASGPDGTTGYAVVRIAKDLADTPEDITVYFDGKPFEYTLNITDYAWILTINYTHSSHKIVITLTRQLHPLEPFPTTLVATASGISIAIIGIGLLFYFKKRKRVVERQ